MDSSGSDSNFSDSDSESVSERGSGGSSGGNSSASDADDNGGREAAAHGAPHAPLAPREQGAQARGACVRPQRVAGLKWTYAFMSERGSRATAAAGLKVTTDARASLSYSVRENLGPNAVAEGKRALKSVRDMRIDAGLQSKLAGQLSSLDCFALAVPETLLVHLVDYAKSAPESKHLFAPHDLVNYMKAEIGMRMANSSSRMFFKGNDNEDLANAHGTVVAALRQADKPAELKVPVDATAPPLTPNSFDAVLNAMVVDLSAHWTKLFFVKGTTACDIDDDKLHHGSASWRSYGFSQQTSKDKKKRPVNNLVATVGGGFILRVMPEKPGLLFIGVLFDYCLLNAYRIYQFAVLEQEMSETWTASKLCRERATVSYQQFLIRLFTELTPEALFTYYPGSLQRLTARCNAYRIRAAEQRASDQRAEQAGQQGGRKYSARYGDTSTALCLQNSASARQSTAEADQSPCNPGKDKGENGACVLFAASYA